MSAIDPFRDLVREWNLNAETIKSQIGTIGNLQRELDDVLGKLAFSEGDIKIREGWRIEDSARIRELEAQLASWQPKPSTLLFSDDFTELPKAAPDEYAIDAPDGAFNVVPGGLEVSYSVDSPRNAHGLAKAEFGPRFGEKLARYGRIPYGVERWHAITVEIPLDWQTDGNKVSVIDVHGSEDAGETGIGRNAPLSLMLWGTDFVGWSLWSDKEIQTENEHRTEILRFPFVHGLPYRWIFRTVFDWSPTGKGETDIWLVRGNTPVSQIYTYRGPNFTRDREGGYWKAGLYLPALKLPESAGKTFAVTKWRLLFSRLRVAGPGATLENLL